MQHIRFHIMSIVITGNPGVGKHTITYEISKNLKLSIIDINETAKSEGLFEKNGNTNNVDTTKLKKVLERKISEKNIVFTGTLNQMSRSEAKSKAEELGAKVVSSVTKNTDYVIVGADSGKKEKIAKELNIKILNENEWIKFISK